MKKKFLVYTKAGLLFLMVLIFCTLQEQITVRADFGDFTADADYGGDYDYDYDEGYDGYNSGSYDSGGSGSSVFTYIAFLIFGGIALLTTGNRSGTRAVRRSGDPLTPDSLLKPLSDYQKLDPSFDETVLKDYLQSLYIQMQIGWHNRDLSGLKPCFTESFYNQYDRQLTDKRAKGEIPVTEDVLVEEVTPRGYYQSGQNDHIVVTIRASLIAYYLDEKTGRLLSGDKTHRKLMTYEWDILRQTGALTAPAQASFPGGGNFGGNAGSSGSTAGGGTCPCCGAALEEHAESCSYCGYVLPPSSAAVSGRWLLDSIKGISQKTL